MARVVLNVRVEDVEMELLKQFCLLTGRSQTDVVRSLLRSLKRKIKDLLWSCRSIVNMRGGTDPMLKRQGLVAPPLILPCLFGQ